MGARVREDIYAARRRFLRRPRGLLFGLMEALNFQAQAVGITVSPFFLAMLPYLFTIAAVVFAAVVGGRRLGAPAALGLPYRREER